MRFGAPHLLHLLWLLIPLAFGLWALGRRRRRRQLLLAEERALAQLADGWQPERVRPRSLLWFLAAAVMLLALARPQWGFHWQEVKRRGMDILVVLDTSRSMLAEDIKPNRLQQAKWGIRDLVHRLQGDRIGLVAFAGSSFLQCPLTIDYAAFRMTLDDIYCGIIPRGGTAIEQALRCAAESFEKGDDADRAVILITDGEDHEGQPLDTLAELKKKNIRVFAIGIGTREGDLLPAAEAGQTGFFKDREGKVVKSALREDVIERLALETGGAYVRSAPGDTGLERVFEQGLAHLKRQEGDARLMIAYEDRFGWFLGLALALLAGEAALRERRREKAGGPMRNLLHPGLAAALLLAAAQAAAAGEARTRWEEGRAAHAQKDYGRAAAAFEKAAQAAPDEQLDPAVARFDQAGSLLRQGRAEEAAALYAEALRTTDLRLQEQAYDNRGRALYDQGLAQEQQQQLDGAKKAVEESVGMYEKAIALDPADLDPKVNFELALQKLQELEEKIQQQKQQQQNQDDKKDQEKNDKQDQEKDKDKDKDDQKKQDQQQKQDEQQKEKPDEPDPQQADPQKDPQQDSAQPQAGQQKEPSEMTPEEAMMLLNAIRQQEQSDRDKIRVNMGRPVPVEKDW